MNALSSILTSIKDLETSLSTKIEKVIDTKLEGMDEVVVELIRCKTDNETLKQKIVDLNKERSAHNTVTGIECVPVLFKIAVAIAHRMTIFTQHKRTSFFRV